MKKLIIAALAICAAVVANAASVTWRSLGIQTTGDFDEGEGDYAAGYSVYLFSQGGDVTRSVMLAAITANEGWDKYFKTDTQQYYLATTVADNDGAISPTAVTVADGDFSGYLVIFDNSDYTKAEYAFVSAIYDENDNSLHKIVMDYDGDSWVNALDYSTAGQAGSNWHSVPEPTSGLLLLVGGALLALKRRRA